MLIHYGLDVNARTKSKDDVITLYEAGDANNKRDPNIVIFLLMEGFDVGFLSDVKFSFIR